MQNTELQNLLWDMGKTIVADLTAALEPVTREQGLTMTQLRLLCEIKVRQPVTVGMLSHIVGENKGNCSSMCKKLEAAGYLIRRRSAEDERCVRLQLTAKTEELLHHISEETEKKYASLTDEIPPKELEAILQGMRRLTQALHRIRKDIS